MRWILEREHFDRVLEALGQKGYRVLGPTVLDGSIVYGDVSSASDLPVGWTDEQEGGTYRLRRRGDEALFGFVVGPHSAKQFFHPPAVRLWQAERAEQLFQIEECRPDVQKVALIGVRSCDLHAIAVQDRVFLEGPFVDQWYRARREAAFLIAINCGKAGGTCFCVSMNTGPKAVSGFDLALTEILQDSRHYFVIEAGSERGAAILREVPCRAARQDEEEAAELVVRRTAGQMGRTMDTTGIKDLLYRNYEHPRWENVAERCLACANCTMVCPTCFCTTVEDSADLTGDRAERWRNGIPASRWTFPISTAAVCGFDEVPLPAVDDPQAGHLDRPVRLLRLRGLRPVHHLVSGSHRHHRGGAGHPRIERPPAVAARRERHGES